MSITIEEVVQFSVNLGLQIKQKDDELRQLKSRTKKECGHVQCQFCGAGGVTLPPEFVNEWRNKMLEAWSNRNKG